MPNDLAHFLQVVCFLAHKGVFATSLARHVYTRCFPNFHNAFVSALGQLVDLGVIQVGNRQTGRRDRARERDKERKTERERERTRERPRQEETDWRRIAKAIRLQSNWLGSEAHSGLQRDFFLLKLPQRLRLGPQPTRRPRRDPGLTTCSRTHAKTRDPRPGINCYTSICWVVPGTLALAQAILAPVKLARFLTRQRLGT